ncbi:Protein of unknown function (DUF4255) [Streptoalloteichus tenebrarius]|uniref:Pvc16 N-terminal domain-containing protein n=1 Tax=Streptoalloteichus tenebrarius (strain ATCC 17920 / DSM 40477 / JCM 4838 / CBS 697.72 / NBRC 16177 / NCIMB 11028 / NRRL B-12390 / A12253. 1 / ISP 5477) TaxID=1933 RepID=A0ABT1HUE9_STRSD|nr:DUF4255 domain-containing protein [Streptoalloteichus tenebrarius]MCP2259153.1 Protein of unknown function (DUF4255) [Streptoalloteichus tenebrarius]BFF04370.1 DUF4255 domain-containing protein [Streptoalloteichus tenebrarius]
MSNVLAVATATEALMLFLARSLPPDIGYGVNVVPGKPPAEPPQEPTITVFLYQVTPNAAMRNRDAPTRGPDGTTLRRPQAAIDLHYLISFFGDETKLVPQQLLGAVVRSLHEEPVLSRADIEAAAQRAHLAGSDLAASPQRVRLTPAQMDLDDLSKLWSTMLQTPYALSVAYQATAVLLDGRSTPASGKPVLRRAIRVEPFVRPVLDRVLSVPSGAAQDVLPDEGPITADRDLVVLGANLRRPGMTALVGGTPASVVRLAEDRVVLRQPRSLTPGTHGVQVRYDVSLGDPPVTRPWLESNAVPYVRRPRVVQARRQRDGVAVRTDIPVGVDQRVVLLLDEHGGGEHPRSYQFDAPFPLVKGPGPVREFTVPVGAVAAGRYLVRVQVDGAQSPLDFADGAFTGPLVDMG